MKPSHLITEKIGSAIKILLPMRGRFYTDEVTLNQIESNNQGVFPLLR